MQLPPPLTAREPVPADHARITAAIPPWWADSRTPEDAARLATLVQPLFLEHFADTCRVVEDGDGALAAFLVGFLSQSRPAEAYVHFVGVRPDLRGTGLGRALYTWFLGRAAAAGRTRVGAITGHGNAGSVRFHRGLGFTVDESGPMVRFSRTIG